jgi:hypothetical protein
LSATNALMTVVASIVFWRPCAKLWPNKPPSPKVAKPMIVAVDKAPALCSARWRARHSERTYWLRPGAVPGSLRSLSYGNSAADLTTSGSSKLRNSGSSARADKCRCHRLAAGFPPFLTAVHTELGSVIALSHELEALGTADVSDLLDEVVWSKIIKLLESPDLTVLKQVLSVAAQSA